MHAGAIDQHFASAWGSSPAVRAFLIKHWKYTTSNVFCCCCCFFCSAALMVRAEQWPPPSWGHLLPNSLHHVWDARKSTDFHCSLYRFQSTLNLDSRSQKDNIQSFHQHVASMLTTLFHHLAFSPYPDLIWKVNRPNTSINSALNQHIVQYQRAEITTSVVVCHCALCCTHSKQVLRASALGPALWESVNWICPCTGINLGSKWQ